MAQYTVVLTRTANASFSLGEVSAGATPRRGFLYEFLLGSEATPGDNAFLWDIQRNTAVGTGSAVTPQSIDPGDTVASNATAQQNMTIEPTFPPTHLVRLALNQRATFRWVAQPGSELVYPATQNNGITFTTPTVGSAVAISGTLFVRE